MALIRQPSTGGLPSGAMVLDLGDLHRRGEMLKQEARAEAARILEAADAERRRLLAGAREEGFAAGSAEGHKAGFEQGRKEGAAAALTERREALSAVDAKWTAAIRSFAEVREQSFRDAGEECVRLALLIAERMVKRVLDSDPSIVVEQARAAVALVGLPSSLVIAVNPADLDLLKDALPSLSGSLPAAAHARLTPDENVPRGGVVVRTSGGMVDATIPTQAERIARELLGGQAAGGDA